MLGDNEIHVSNAIIYFLRDRNPAFEEEARLVNNYVLDCLKNQWTLKRILEQAPEYLGCYIHVDSFLYLIKTFLSRNNPQVNTLLFDLDDLYIFNDHFLLKSGAEDIVRARMPEIYNKIEYANITETTVLNTTVTTNNPTNASSDSDNSSIDYSEWNWDVFLLTILSFIFIRSLSWLSNKLFKRPKEDSSSLEHPKEEESSLEHPNQEDTLKSAFEPHILLDVTSILLLMLIPTSIIILYQYRYYFLYCLKFKK